MSREDHNKVGYVISLISEFAVRHGLNPHQAYEYLKNFKGLDYLYEHYNVLHTFTFADSVDAVLNVCRHNGGKL
ncbi:MAG: DUF3791 domain-containing protein [Bacteroidaceae bacterium]|nr:DUF3791 domain-containing protein [Bacteroidaceae bacterium]